MRFRAPRLSRGPRQAPGEAPPRDPRPKPPFLRSMPAPLMALFLALVLVALGLVVWTAAFPERVAPPTPAQRRPAPAAGLTHAVGEVVLAPVPDPLAAYVPPCEAMAGARPEGGPPGVARLTEALRLLCPLAQGGVAPEIARALEGLDGARIRFARFDLTGVESATDLSSRRILLNLKFAKGGSRVDAIGPVLVHEGYHLALGAEPPTAEAEWGARVAELAACRELIRRDRWPRGCRDAEELVALGRDAAIAALRAEGYA